MAEPLDSSTPWREAEFCVVDIETTGLDPAVDEIISFAALHIARGRIRLDDALYQLVKPSRMPEPETIVIHGLRAADLAGAPPLADVLDSLVDVLAGRVMVAHVAAIEQAFIGAALRRDGRRFANPIVDTAALAAELHSLRREPPPAPRQLTTLAHWLGLPVHRPHEADGDALTTAQVFLALASHLDRFRPQTVGSLERISRRLATRRSPLRARLARVARSLGERRRRRAR